MNTMGTPQTWSHFNMLDLHETVRTLSQCHHFCHKKNVHVKKKHGNTTNMVSFQHAGFARNIAHTESVSSFLSQEKCTCQKKTMGTPQTWSHFNMLDLHETVHTLSQCHHFCPKKNAHAKKTQWAHHLQHAGFARNIAHTESMSFFVTRNNAHVK